MLQGCMALFKNFRQAQGADAPPQWLVRLAVGALVLAAVHFAATADTPTQLPSVPLKQELVYRGELLLAVLYGLLLIATPVVRGFFPGYTKERRFTRSIEGPRQRSRGFGEHLSDPREPL